MKPSDAVPNLVRGLPAAAVKAAPELPPQTHGLGELMWSDYRVAYAHQSESPRRRALMWVPRLATNSSLHAAMLTRLVQGTSPRLAWLWRRLLLMLHGCDISHVAHIGPGLWIPHPVGIVISPHSVLGENVVLGPMVGISPATTNWRNAVNTVQIGDGVIFAAGAFVLGELTIGDGAIIGPRSLIIRDVPAGHLTTARGEIRPATDEDRDGAAQRPPPAAEGAP